MRNLLWASLLWVLAGGLWAGAVSVSNRVQKYSMGFLPADEAERAVKAIVGNEGTVTVDPLNNQIWVTAPGDVHQIVQEIMKEAQVPPKNVRISVKFERHALSSDSEASIMAEGSYERSGRASGGRVRMEPRLSSRVTEGSDALTQMLLVTSGREATLWIGESVPYLEWLVDYGVHGGIISGEIKWQKVGARLVVQPKVIGGGPMVVVRLIPELSGLVDGNPYRVRFVQAATEVTVRDGESIRIGGLDKHQDFYSHFLVGLSRNGRKESVDITLTPHIESPAMPPGRTGR